MRKYQGLKIKKFLKNFHKHMALQQMRTQGAQCPTAPGPSMAWRNCNNFKQKPNCKNIPLMVHQVHEGNPFAKALLFS